eukprot:Em0006g1049a
MVSEVDSCKWSIDKLDSSNWMTWKFLMKHLLLSKGLWGIVDGSERLAEDASVQQQAEFRKRAQTAFSTLVLSINSSQLYLITSCEEPAPAWVALRNHFERDTLVNKLMLKKQYFRREMKEGSSIEAHIKAMKELTDKLAAIKAPISEEDQVVTLLGSLPSSYSTLVTALEARDAVSLSYVQQALIQEEQRMNVVDSKSDAGQSAVFDEKTGRAFVGKQSQQCQKGRQQKVCYLCGETGHIRWNCPENHQERSLSKPKHIAKPVKTMEEDSELACGASSKSYNKENWIVDSGASSHMTQTQEFMVNYEEFGTPQKVCLGDGRTLEAFGKGRVYFMKRKSEAFDKFKEFERCSTNECGLSIGIFRSDNGGEYISKEFEKFLLDKGIHHELSAPYSPAQNGVAERINRTLMESARTMMAQAGLSDKYWAEAVVTGTFLRNRVPARSFKEKTTPFEKWYEKKPDLSHLRVFGCMAYAYIPDTNRKDKLSKKAEKLRFIGYSLQTKAYRLINDDTGKIIVRRDVIFNESDFQYDSTTGTVGAEGITFKRDEVVIQEIPKEVEWPEQVQEEVELEQEQQEQEDAEQSRYPRRMRIAPTRYGIDEYVGTVLMTQLEEPQSITEALESDLSEQWREAADSEYQSLMQNETWERVELPKGRKPVGCKWVFKAKRGSDGKVQRFKARLVAKGFTQKHGIDYDETFSPVVRFTSVRTILAFAVQNGMMVHQMDVVTAFLNGTLEEEIYMEQPPGYIKKGEEHLVCKLKKSIYGLMLEQVRTEGTETTIIAVYVDDLIIIAKNPETMERIKGSLTERFKMKDLGKLHYCLGINIEYDENKRCLWMHQRPYIQSLLERYQLSEAKSSCTPADINVKLVKDDGAAKLADSVCYQSMVGSLLYAAIATRPDIAQAVGAVSKFNSCPTETHLTGVKRILRYLKGTINLGLNFEKTADSSIIGFSDADWAGDLDNRHSTSGNLFVMSGGTISWLSKKQPVVALSTTEAEYVALGAATQEVVWLRRLLSDIKASPKMPTIISEDNQGTIAIARNPVYHARTKHIDIKYHYVREALMDGVIDLVYCPTQQMTADILTKPLSRDQFETLRHEMGLKDIPQ